MVWTLGVTETISYGVLFYAVAVFLSPMREELHATLGELSGAVSLSLAVTGFSAPLVGKWLDEHGARVLMTVGSLVGALSVVGWANAHSLPQLYLSFLGIGLAGAAVYYEAAFATINKWFYRDRASALLTVTVIAGFASTIFLPGSQLLINHFGWRHALLVLAGLIALCAIPHAMVLRRDPADHGVGQDGEPIEIDLVNTPLNVVKSKAEMKSEVRVARARSEVRWLTVAYVTSNIATTVVTVLLVTYLLSRGYLPGAAALGAGLIGVMSVAGRIAITSFARRFRLARLAAVTTAGQAFGIAALVWLPRPTGLILFIFAFGAGFGVMTIARVALLGEYVDASVFARVSGGQALAVNIARVLAPVTAGLIIGASGGYGLTLAAVALCSLLSAAALIFSDAAAQTAPRHT